MKSKVKVLGAKIGEKHEGKVRLMFQDEAGFGRINKPQILLVQEGHSAGECKIKCVSSE